jgi:hypothetical protein
LIIDDLVVKNGFFKNNRFIVRGILGYAIFESYMAEGLQLLARLIHDDEQVTFTIDNNSSIHIPVKLNVQ